MCLVRRAVRHFGQKGLARGRQTEKLTTEGASTLFRTHPRASSEAGLGNGKEPTTGLFSQRSTYTFEGCVKKQVVEHRKILTIAVPGLGGFFDPINTAI